MLQNVIPGLVQRVMPAAVASGLFVSLCTAQQPSGAVTPYNQPDGTYTDVAGLVNIQCMKAVLAMNTIDATEVKALSDIMSESFWHVVLNGYYPAFFLNGTGPGGQQVGWRVIVDGVKYDLVAAEPDSQRTQTRLKLQIVTVAGA